MDDLISRQAAIDVLGGEPMTYTEYEQGLHDKWIDIKENIEALPSAQPEIIRCCDCIHFKYFEDQFVQMTRCDVHDRCPDYTDYCSWAERKEE